MTNSLPPGNWFMFDLANEDSEETSALGVQLQRVSPLIALRVAVEAIADAPVIPRTEQKMPDGSVVTKENPGDPTYKEALKQYRAELNRRVANAYISAGVRSGPEVLDQMTPAQMGDLVKSLRSASFASEASIQVAMQAIDPLVIEGMVAAKTFDVNVFEFFTLDIGLQSLLIGAFRATRQRPQR